MTEPRPPALLRAAEIRARESSHSHPWNPQSQLIGLRLSTATGLQRTGVSLVRLPPGKESFVYHAHRFEEEWIYILSGRGIAEIDGAEYQVGAGDFMGFGTPGVAHHLRNPFHEPLQYLMGGENREFEIAEFPRLGKRMVRAGTEVTVYDAADGRPFGPLK
jgi:uncharacterized cupin superfamily protein